MRFKIRPSVYDWKQKTHRLKKVFCLFPLFNKNTELLYWLQWVKKYQVVQKVNYVDEQGNLLRVVYRWNTVGIYSKVNWPIAEQELNKELENKTNESPEDFTSG